MIDIHSHILPGIDDGAETFDDSISIIRELESQGVTDIIATPHYIEETIYTSPRAKNRALLERLHQKLKAAKIDINIHLGNEIYINGDIHELLKKGIISSLADSKYLLIEFPMDGEYPNYQDIFKDLLDLGYQVILAHPERYTSVRKDFSLLNELLDMGVLFQCNLGSVTGRYGKHVQKIAKKLAKRKMVFCFASDIHHCHGDDYILTAQDKLAKFYSKDELDALLVKNPAKILGK